MNLECWLLHERPGVRVRCGYSSGEESKLLVTSGSIDEDCVLLLLQGLSGVTNLEAWLGGQDWGRFGGDETSENWGNLIGEIVLPCISNNLCDCSCFFLVLSCAYFFRHIRHWSGSRPRFAWEGTTYSVSMVSSDSTLVLNLQYVDSCLSLDWIVRRKSLQPGFLHWSLLPNLLSRLFTGVSFLGVLGLCGVSGGDCFWGVKHLCSWESGLGLCLLLYGGDILNFSGETSTRDWLVVS